ncbi:MAG: cell division protein FtsZ, partial [Rhodospirillales bacterium]|nr:cell division protein FtsZ [Rhodospirillales bacterium]
MTLNLTIPQTHHQDFSPRIIVIGVGGGGTNAVDNMIALQLQGVDFIVANTDAQQLINSRADTRIQLGPSLTQGLGAGAKPEIGRGAAEEAIGEIERYLEGAHMAFVTAGMGGGTGTGAAPVIARLARERGILTVGVVTRPFAFEGSKRARAAEAGIRELQSYVDTLIVIPNQNLFRLANEKTGWREAFKMADNVLYMAVRGVTDLMVLPGLINLDFADIKTVMAEMGNAMMGTGEADGEDRARRAAEAAINNPLIEGNTMAGARALLINITGGEDMTLHEVDEAANRVRQEVDDEAEIIFGTAIDPALEGKLRVSIVATGIESAERGVVAPRLVAVGGGTAPQPAVAGAPAPTGAAPQTPSANAQPVALQQPAGNQAGRVFTIPAPAAGAARPLPGRAPMRAGGPAPLAMATAATPSSFAATPLRHEPARPEELQAEVEEAQADEGGIRVIDDTPLPAPAIPAHLQQPVRPVTARAARPAARAGGLFAATPEAA